MMCPLQTQILCEAEIENPASLILYNDLVEITNSLICVVMLM